MQTMEPISSYRDRLTDTLPRIRAVIRDAARRVDRDPESVGLVAVTKGHETGAIEAALETGLLDIGENRIGALEARHQAFSRHPGVRWHMIGHLQSRKAPRVHGRVSLLHSLDSLKVAERIDRSRPDGSPPVRGLLQVNTSGEAAKYGFDPEAFKRTLPSILALPGIRVAGLMTMAPFTGNEGEIRDCFRGLRLLDEWARSEVEGYEGEHLSMGMSNDYELAVEEGSTLLRLGTVLFGERPE